MDNAPKIVTRTCSVCLKEKPLTDEFFYRQGTAKYGFKYYCKECCKKTDKLIYAKNREMYIARAKDYQKARKKTGIDNELAALDSILGESND